MSAARSGIITKMDHDFCHCTYLATDVKLTVEMSIGVNGNPGGQNDARVLNPRCSAMGKCDNIRECPLIKNFMKARAEYWRDKEL